MVEDDDDDDDDDAGVCGGGGGGVVLAVSMHASYCQQGKGSHHLAYQARETTGGRDLYGPHPHPSRAF